MHGELVRTALQWAAELHAGQCRRDGSLVIDHVLAVAEDVLGYCEADPEVVAAAVLHDVVEKTETTVPQIAGAFGPRVARLVEAVTVPPGMTPDQALAQAIEAGQEALLLRLCDRLDGVRRSPGRPPADRQRFVETARRVHLPAAREHWPRLAEALARAIADASAPPSG